MPDLVPVVLHDDSIIHWFLSIFITNREETRRLMSTLFLAFLFVSFR